MYSHSTVDLHHQRAVAHKTNPIYHSVQNLNKFTVKEETLDESKYFKPASPGTQYYNDLIDAIESGKTRQKVNLQEYRALYKTELRQRDNELDRLQEENISYKAEIINLKSESYHNKILIQQLDQQLYQARFESQDFKLKYYELLLARKEENLSDRRGDSLYQNGTSTIKKSVSADSGFSAESQFTTASVNEEEDVMEYELFKSKTSTKKHDENYVYRVMMKTFGKLSKKSNKRRETKKLEHPPILFKSEKS